MGELNIPPGTLAMLILETLVRLGPQHGYGIAQFIQATTGGALEVEEGSLYPALQRMRLKGWVTADWRQTDNNRRARYYTLTPEGRQALRREVKAFDRTQAAIAAIIHPVEA